MSLIELMISVTIGLFIALALTAVFVNMKSAFTAQDGLAQLQDSERVALGVLTASIEQAGYFPNPLTNTATAALPVPALPAAYGSLVAGQRLVGTTGTAPASDTLVTQYSVPSGSPVGDCLGQLNTSGAAKQMTNVFIIDANNELECSDNLGTQFTPIAANVSGMIVTYGVDSTASGNVTTYQTATQVAAANQWSAVKTVRLSLTFVNPFASSLNSTAIVRWVHVVNLMNNS